MRPSDQIALWLLSALLAALAPARVDAQPPVHSYALVIGSNRGGAGQTPLSFAERDAERVSDLLRELGRTRPEHIERLTQPSASDVERALSRLRDKLAGHQQRGERAQLLFYYSGHARAHSLSLGDDELSLPRLRESLRALPSTLTVVVLDACQSGAFSGIKGAAPAADFSMSSVVSLESSGIAVMASSTGSELSQESRELGSGYFTHHLLVSLRGAGDLDGNGRVSLDEAYRYAYQHTLSDTARTQVGSQHATLETDLKGRGDVPLSYPVDADAQLSLPPDVGGRVLVQRANRGPVLAELVKATGTSLLLALPAGAYEVLVRGERNARSCRVRLTRGLVHELSLAACSDVPLATEQAKASARSERELDLRRGMESWFLEGGASLIATAHDPYRRRLDTFGYYLWGTPGVGTDLALGYTFKQRFALVLRHSLLESVLYMRSSDWNALNWITHAVTLSARVRWPVLRGWLVPFAEGGAGLALATSSFDFATHGLDAYPDYGTHHDLQLAPALRATAGATIRLFSHIGCYLAAGYTYAPALKNSLGERRDSGGITFVTGLRIHGVKGWW